MIEFQNTSVRFGPEALFENASFRINTGERVGIVGPNGAGKSTLFRLILGEQQSDTGDVKLEGSPRIGYVRQYLEPSYPGQTLLAYCLEGVPGLQEIETAIHEQEAALAAAPPEDEKARLLKSLGDLHARFEHLGGYTVEARVKSALGGLGYANSDFDRPFAAFSGGWRMRAELSRVLASSPELLLLDEPSNYLDLPAIEWLQRYLRSYEGTLVLISHDRYLLRNLTKTIVEVDGGTVTRYNGDLDYYLQERENRYEQLAAAKANQDRKREQLERFVERFKAKASKAAQAQSRAKQLEKMDEIKLPARSRSAGALRLPAAPHAGAEIVRLEGVGFRYPGAERDVLHSVDLRVMRGDKIAIVGFNGMGKTTLLRLLAGTREPGTGERVFGYHVAPGYQSQEFAETVAPDESVFAVAKAAAGDLPEKDLRNRLGAFGFDVNDAAKPSGVLSGGEKIRLAFLRIFLNPPNFLLLDEPTTHLDMEGRKTLETAIQAYNGTVVLVSHDVDFVRATATSIVEVSPLGVRRFPGGYDYYKEKTASDPGALPAEAPAEEPARQSSKELRQQRAAERAKRAPLVKKLKHRVERAEAAITRLETEQETLTGSLAALESAEMAAASKRLRDIAYDLHVATLEWEEAATELETLETSD